jgi:hypothetical protein
MTIGGEGPLPPAWRLPMFSVETLKAKAAGPGAETPNVKDEPRPSLARLVHLSTDHSVVSYQPHVP